ncbi:MAG: HAD-IIIA family hydrolase [Candidatus Thermoplasmatota archaeon]|nr:HAD-IIIA family hydrolase [Candidatus Thermoplasmatota archaeon]
MNRDCPYCHDPAQLHVFMDSVRLMKQYQQKGFLIIIITNQSGVNRGYFTEEDLGRFNTALVKRLAHMGVRIDAIYYCPHRPDEGCKCRKPGTGLVEKAMHDFPIDLEHSVMVGDRDDIDGEMAGRLGIEFINILRTKQF